MRKKAVSILRGLSLNALVADSDYPGVLNLASDSADSSAYKTGSLIFGDYHFLKALSILPPS